MEKSCDLIVISASWYLPAGAGYSDGLPAHEILLVKAYVASTNGRLTLHVLSGYAPELNRDELVWSHMRRTGVARNPLRKGEKLLDKVEAQLAEIRRLSDLVRLFFRAPSIVYIADW
jgi:transposase